MHFLFKKEFMSRFPDKEFMPISINVKNKKIILIGGGRIAFHKLASLLLYTNNIVVIAKEVSDQIKNTEVTYIEKEYELNDILDAFIIYACTNNRELNSQVYADAINNKILVNVVDNPALCDFVSPAIYKKEHISIAVSSNAQDVYSSIAHRDKIKNYFEHDSIK